LTEQITEIECSPATPLEKIDKNLSSIFGTEPMEIAPIQSNTPVVPPKSEDENKDIEVDAEFVRSNMYSLVQQGQDALNYALELAKQSDSPRAFEVVGTLMKNISDINMQLLDAQEKKQKLKGKTTKEESGPQKVVNNSIVFQGSTADLNKLLSDMRKEQ
jgi:hypothetical protein